MTISELVYYRLVNITLKYKLNLRLYVCGVKFMWCYCMFTSKYVKKRKWEDNKKIAKLCAPQSCSRDVFIWWQHVSVYRLVCMLRSVYLPDRVWVCRCVCVCVCGFLLVTQIAPKSRTAQKKFTVCLTFLPSENNIIVNEVFTRKV